MQQLLAAKRGRAGSSTDTMHALSVEPPQPLPSAPLLRGSNKPAEPSSPLAGGVLLDTSTPKGASPKAGLSDPDGSTGDLPKECPPTGDPSIGGSPQPGPSMSVAELEESLLAGLLGTKKRPASSLADPGNAEAGAEDDRQAVKKKPAAKPILKRPAGHTVPGASNIDMSGIFAKLRARKGTVSRKIFTSQAYHAAKVLAENSGFSADQAKAIGREALAKASILFDQ